MKKISLIKKYIIFLLLTSIIPLTVIGVMSFDISKSIIQEEANRYTVELIENHQDYMELLLNEVESLIANISSIDDIRNVLENDNIEMDNYTNLATQAKMGYILSGYTHLKGLVSIDIFTAGGIHYHVGDTLNIQQINEEVKNKIYQKVSNSTETVVWTGIEDNVNINSKNNKVITAGKALKIIEPGTLKEKNSGLLLVNYSVDYFYDYFSKRNLGQGSYMMIVDNDDRLIYYPDRSKIGKKVNPIFLKRLNKNKDSFNEVINDQKMQVTYSKLEKNNWLLISFVPVSTLIAKTSNILNNMLFVLGFCFFIVFLTGLLVSNRVVTPINKITNLFKKIQEGKIDLQMRLEEKSSDEIGELIRWFNKFIENSVDKNRAEEQLRKARYELEMRVEERTKELAMANESLKREIFSRKKSEEKLKYLSLHDPLTGIGNRTSFQQEIQRLGSIKNQNISIIICDVDGLKLVNDSLGHHSGDKLLVNAARIINDSVRSEDFVARIGGDEFAVIFYSSEKAVVEHVCNEIKKSVERYNKENPCLPISISIGFAICNSSVFDLDEVFKEADNNMYREKLFRGKSARSAIVHMMMKALEARDFVTEGHVERVQNLVILMGSFIGLSSRELTDLRLFAQFHDIGKVGIPDRILFKTGRLTAEERTEMQRHSEIGYRIAQSAQDLVPIADWILKHHEWWDGGGYPFGIKREEIPLECRILAIADAYDAMTADRPYRKSLSHDEAILEIIKCSGVQFDPELVDIFVRLFDKPKVLGLNRYR